MTNVLTPLRLGVNIDHVATLRNARGAGYPELMRSVDAALAGGADSITAHLREDRRHIRDQDIYDLAKRTDVRLNLEMAMTEEMIAFALKIKPHAICLVPENRMELTTEGGLDVIGHASRIQSTLARLSETGARLSLFVEPEAESIKRGHALGANAVELHTGPYCAQTEPKNQMHELKRIHEAAALGAALNLEVHAGHGLTYANTPDIAAITSIVELNIGHFLVSEAVFIGLEASVRRMRNLMNEARL